MAIFGLQRDIDHNPGRGVQLYVPNKTKLSDGDVFIGGEGTGVTDAMLGKGVSRVYGDNAKATARALESYMDEQGGNDMATQLRSVIAANAAPRVDADRGVPTLARQGMEAGQAQNIISNNMAQKSFDHSVGQDAFANEYNVANMMGDYRGNPTLSAKAQQIQQAQFAASLARSGGGGSSGGSRSSGGGSAKPPTQTQISNNITGQTMDYLSKWAAGQALDDNGKLKPRATADQIQAWVKEKSGELKSQGANTKDIASWAEDNFTWNPASTSSFNTQTQSWGTSPTAAAKKQEPKWKF